MRRAGCTIISPNYLSFARTLAGSYRAHHPEQPFFVLIVADLDDVSPFSEDAAFTPVSLREIGVPNLRAAAMRYDILELNTNVKPTLLRYLLDQHGIEALVYLDPDILVYAPLEPAFAVLEQGASAVLTPHMTTPVSDGRSPSEQDLLYNGTYNLGFIGIGSSVESRRLLGWWEQRCLESGFSEGRTGLFVDQKWINLVPGLFDRVAISRDPGMNMAYWNLHERRLSPTAEGYVVHSPVQDGVPLRFFHFSGAAPAEPEVLSRNSDRFTLEERPDLQELFRAYKAAVLGQAGREAERLPYGFDQFSDGVAITRLARRLFAAHEERFQGEPDAFAASSSFSRFARSQGLVRGRAMPGKATWREFNPQDRRVTAVHRLFRLALRVLGPNRYELLMRYLGHLSVLRHQGVLIRDKHWPANSSGR